MPERDIEFEWDEAKAARNLQKHRVSFDEAATAFGDELALFFDDEFHSDDEPREWLLGYSGRNRLLIVSFVLRAPNRIRIISARGADRSERRKYEEEPRF